MLKLGADIAKNYIRRRIVRWVLLALPIILLIIFVISLPLLLVEEAKDLFNAWLKGKSEQYQDSGQAIDVWIESLDVGLQIGEGYLNKAMLKKMRQYEKESTIENKTLSIKKRIKKKVIDELDGESEYSYSDDVSYELLLGNATGKYKLPWQVLAAKNILLIGDGEPGNTTLIDTMNNMFKTQYYGLLEGVNNELVDSAAINNRSDYKFLKTVEKKTTVEEDYYVTSYVTDEEGNTTEVEEGPYHRTTITREYIEYPLPYFTRIQTMFETYDFVYDIETSTTTQTHRYSNGKERTVVTTVTEPKLRDTNVLLDTDRYIANLKTLGIELDPDVAYLKEMIANLPYGESLSVRYDPILTSISNMRSFDMYYGAESGNAEFKLTGEGAMIWPVNFVIKISSGFGMRFHPVLSEYKFHSGIDIPSPQGTKVYAAADGIVKSAGNGGSYGNLVVLSHSNGITSYYAHLSYYIVRAGEKVTKGQLIAYSGGALGSPGAGRSTGAHLHFETRLLGSPVNPADLLGLVPDIPDTLPEELAYSEVDINKLRSWLEKKNSILSEEPYLSAITEAAEVYNVNPLLMFAITGQEQSFVKRTAKDAEKIANNPFNVYHSWYEYNTSIYDTSRIAAKTIVNLSKGRPEGINPIYWINSRGGAGGYAEDLNWWQGVSKFLSILKKEVGYL